MTTRLRIARVDLISLSGTDYRPVEIDRDVILLERVDASGVTLAFGHEELRDLLKAPDARYRPSHFDPRQQKLARILPYAQLAAYPTKVQTQTLYKWAVATAFYSFYATARVKRTEASINAHRCELKAEADRLDGSVLRDRRAKRAGAPTIGRKFPCASTILTWVRQLEAGGHNILALVPKTFRSGRRDQRWSRSEEAMIATVIDEYCTLQRPSKVSCAKAVRAKFETENEARIRDGLAPLRVPSISTLCRRLSMADPYSVHARRYGVEAANRKFCLFEAGVGATFPLERVEMDGYLLDVLSILDKNGFGKNLSPDQRELLKPIRRWVIGAKDCATKVILTTRLTATNTAVNSVLALRDLFADKTEIANAAGCESRWDHHGGIGTIVCDQGSEFIDEAFRTTVTSVGVTVHYPPAGIPHLRGTMEVFFLNLVLMLMPRLAGRTFSHPRDCGNYPSEDLACLNDDDLITALLRYVVDVYHNQPHTGLGGETPNNCWRRLVAEHGVPATPDGLSLRVAFGRPLTRVLQGDGVVVAGITYSCEALRDAFLHSSVRTCEVRIDLHDLGWVAVKVGSVWHSALSNTAGFDGVTYAQLKAATLDLRARYGREAEISAPIVRAALAGIDDINRAAMRRASITPMDITDEELARNEEALHFTVRSDAERLGRIVHSADPLTDGIEIRFGAATQPTSPAETPAPRKAWRFDDE